MVKVLIVGQTPPPFNGQGIMIDRLVKSELADVELIHVRMGFSSQMNEMGRVRMSKVLHLFGVIAQIMYHRFAQGVRILYYPPAGPQRVPVMRDVIILLATRWLFEKTVFHFHAGGVSELYDRLQSWQQWFFRRAYFGADAAIRLSDLNPEDGRRLAAKRDYVVPYGIDDPCPESSIARSNRAAEHEHRLRFLFVGVLSEAKGVMVLIEACGRLAACDVPFQLELMGQWESDDFAARVNERIDELNLKSQIRFLGVLVGDEKHDVYRLSDVFCFPTHFEGETFGLVLLEAMASSLPVVATRWRGIPSVVDDGQSGFLIEPDDSDALFDRLVRLGDDPRLRERMGSAGRVKFEREYSFPRYASRIRRVLLETAGQSVDEIPEVNGNVHLTCPEAAETLVCRSGSRVQATTA